MFCRQCGAQVEENATFCMQCGTRADAIPQPMPEAPVAYQIPNQPLYASPEIPPKKPINKKKLVLSLLSILLCLSLVAGIFVYFTYFATAERALFNAAEDSAEALEQFLPEGSELKKLVDALENIDDEFTINLSAGTDDLSLAFSSKKELISLMLHMDEIHLQAAADNEKLVLSLPDYLDGSYSIPLANFGNAFLNSPLGESAIASEIQGFLQDIDIRIFDIPSRQDLKEQEFYQEFVEKHPIEIVDTSIPHSEGIETIYSIQMEMDDYAIFSQKCSNFMLEPILGKQFSTLVAYSMLADPLPDMKMPVTILFGLDEKDRLVALHAETEVDGESHTFTIALTGKPNPWEQIEVYADGKQEVALSIHQEDDGFALYVDEECFLRADNEKIVIESEGDTLTVYYEVRQGNCYFTIEIEGQRTELELLPTCNVEMPTSDIVDIFSLTTEELAALMAPFSSLIY